MAPSEILPVPVETKVVTSSLIQASKGLLVISVPAAEAELNFQVACVISWVFVFGAGSGVSLLLQEKIKSEAIRINGRAIWFCFFIYRL